VPFFRISIDRLSVFRGVEGRNRVHAPALQRQFQSFGNADAMELFLFNNNSLKQSTGLSTLPKVIHKHFPDLDRIRTPCMAPAARKLNATGLHVGIDLQMGV
jgi:hypothetical protein